MTYDNENNGGNNSTNQTSTQVKAVIDDVVDKVDIITNTTSYSDNPDVAVSVI